MPQPSGVTTSTGIAIPRKSHGRVFENTTPGGLSNYRAGSPGDVAVNHQNVAGSQRNTWSDLEKYRAAVV
jgi:hypothetical protein